MLTSPGSGSALPRAARRSALFRKSWQVPASCLQKILSKQSICWRGGNWTRSQQISRSFFEMLGSVPGGRVLDGNWGQEHIAIAIPKDRDKGMEYVRHFVDDVQANGTLAQAISRAGLRGVLEVRN